MIELGVESDTYGALDYERCQHIGAAVTFLDCDGLIAPSARWPCENLMIFTANCASERQLELASTTEVEWTSWAKQRRLWAD